MRKLLTILALCLVPSFGSATAIVEAPWAPRAAAYRLTLFLGNLDPVPWEQLEKTWTAPVAGSALPVSAGSLLTDLQSDAIQSALSIQDRQLLFKAATLAIAEGILGHLEAAQQSLGTPEATIELARAEALYRAIDDGIRAGDSASARQLGRAWLALNSSLGTAGVLGNGAQTVQVDAFDAAFGVISAYMQENYLLSDFVERAVLSSVPESAILSGAQIDLPATLPPGTNIADQVPLPRLVLQFEEAGLDETDLPLVAYGDMLFDSPEIFGGPAKELGIACSSCHNRSDVNRDFFIPGLSSHAGGMDVDGSFFNGMFNDRADDHLDTPSLRGIRFTAPYGRDGREPSLRRFTRNVIVKEFAGIEPTPFQLDALMAYMVQFDWLPNPKIDRAGILTDLASEAATRGEALFFTPFAGLGDKSCASCHTPERNFRDGLTHDIGSSEPPFEGGTATQFDTPTLRNVNFTAPYMHDGSLPTLSSVVDWFNDTKGLELGEAGRADLTAYLEAVGDGEEPYQVFEGRDSAFRLVFDELTTFASTLEVLIPAQDQENIAILVDTVAKDLAADASAMTNHAAKSSVYEFAAILRAVGDASADGNWAEADSQWQAFKTKQSEIDEEMF